MKIREILFLIRYEVRRGVWLIPLIYSLFILETYSGIRNQPKIMFSLNGGGAGQGLIMTLLFAFNAVFMNTRTANQTAQGNGWWGGSNFDFFFSRALNRRSWFMVKAGMFTLLVLAPAVLLCWISRQAAPVKIELPYNSAQHRHETGVFYQAEFSGAHLEKADTGQNEDYVVVPGVRQREALLQVAANLLLLSCFEVIAFLFWPRSWGTAVAILIGLIAYFWFVAPSMHTPSQYEAALALIGNHPCAVLAVLLLIFFAAQGYCGWKFVRTECIS